MPYVWLESHHIAPVEDGPIWTVKSRTWKMLWTLTAYARFAGTPLKVHKIANPWRSPTGSLPALKTEEDGSFSHPSKIIIQLRKQKYNADYDLSVKEGADMLAFISLVEEKLMPALIYALWIEPKNYVEVTRPWHAENITFPLNFFLPSRMQCQHLERVRLMRGNGTLEAGEEAEKELYSDALECMNLLSQRLGSNRFFFGDSPSSLDAYVFGYLAPLLKIRLPSSGLQQHLKTLDNLTKFCSNILSLYFPDENRGVSQPASNVQESSDFDHEPYKRGKQLLSILVAAAAMLGYALLTGIVAIEHVKEKESKGNTVSTELQDEEEE
ncbi:metaxin-1a isoform X2 [Neoarius graeffei]|uniref:metaxin-1a isoform X2 n=1 Tax=Neoarius graeffei TaxID=443677 RepID=UPI00298BFBE2|nr:metaxin-1a isoform X2 [Neoarius graeffei]